MDMKHEAFDYVDHNTLSEKVSDLLRSYLNSRSYQGGGRHSCGSTEGCTSGGGAGWPPPPPPPPPPPNFVPPPPPLPNFNKPLPPKLEVKPPQNFFEDPIKHNFNEASLQSPKPVIPPTPAPPQNIFRTPSSSSQDFLSELSKSFAKVLSQSKSPAHSFVPQSPERPPNFFKGSLYSPPFPPPPTTSAVKVEASLSFESRTSSSHEPHPFRALEDKPTTVLRSNPLYTEEEEQEVAIIVDEIEEIEGDPEGPRVPRRAPSTSSGYGSGGGSHGRSSPSLPKNDQFESERLDSKNEGSQSTSLDGSPNCTLSRSLKDDIRACLGGCRWETEVVNVVDAAVKGAGGITVARARLHAALFALQSDGPIPKVPNRGPSLPYCGPGVRPGDVTMMPKNTEMSLFAASALFTLDGARSEALARRLARGERRRRRCRAILSIIALVLLIASVGAVELFLSRGRRLFGAVLR